MKTFLLQIDDSLNPCPNDDKVIEDALRYIIDRALVNIWFPRTPPNCVLTIQYLPKLPVGPINPPCDCTVCGEMWPCECQAVPLDKAHFGADPIRDTRCLEDTERGDGSCH